MMDFPTLFSLPWNLIITLAVLVLSIFILIRGKYPLDLVMLAAAASLVMLGVLKPQEFLSSFSNEVLLLIALFSIIASSFEVSGVVDLMARKVLSSSKSPFSQLASLIFPVGLASACLNHLSITLMMTPIVRKWAIMNKMYPSQFLIPLTYATIFGGALTLIGSNANLTVQALLNKYHPQSLLSFFEIGKIGLPLFIIGFLYLFLIFKWLPKRKDPAQRILSEAHKFVGDFILDSDSQFIGKDVGSLQDNALRGKMLLKVIRKGIDIPYPPSDFVFEAEDRVIIAADIFRLLEMQSMHGLNWNADPKLNVSLSSSHLSELVITPQSYMIGNTLGNIQFRKTYGGSVIAIFREGKRLETPVRTTQLWPGDTLMVVSAEPLQVEELLGKDFYAISLNKKMNPLHIKNGLISGFALIGLAIASLMGFSLTYAAIFAVALIIITQSISTEEARKAIPWGLLLLIASSFALGQAIEKSGLASILGSVIYSFSGNSTTIMVGAILFISILMTEIISHSATAIILYPIIMNMLVTAGYNHPDSIKAAAIALIVGTTSGFALPTAHQSHMVVFSPGGYTIKDFIKAGLWLDLLFLFFGAILIPLIWPFQKG